MHAKDFHIAWAYLKWDIQVESLDEYKIDACACVCVQFFLFWCMNIKQHKDDGSLNLTRHLA